MAVQLGIFLCMRCAGAHRKLGTHITKVKSLSMDSWTNDQVEVRAGSRWAVDVRSQYPGYEADRKCCLESKI